MKKLITLLILLLLVSCNIKINTTKELNKEKTFLGYISDINGDMILLLNTEVYLTTVNSSLKQTLINTATDQITKYHKLLDSHHKYLDENNNEIVNITVLNESIGKGPIKVDPIIIETIEEAINLSKLTDGYFNFTLGGLSNLYSDKLLPYDSFNTDPDKEEIEKLVKGIIDPKKMDEYIIIDKENNTIELKENDYPYLLDLGAFSKGYIIDKAYKELVKYDTSFLLNAGASSIVAYSNEDEDITWIISIANPEDKNDQLLNFSLNNGALSTSGDYENYYFLEDNTRRHHILNPYTGYSENFYTSNTLVSNNAGIIDALSTALFNIDKQEDFINTIKKVEEYYNTDISFLTIQDGLNIYMDRTFNSSIVGNIPLSNFYSVTTTIIEK